MNYFNYYFKVYFGLAILAVFLLQGCNKDEDNIPETPDLHVRGEFISSKSLGSLTPDNIQQILDASNVQVPFTLLYTVDVLSVNYYTVDGEGNEQIASGAFFIPQGVDNLPLLSLQHGTETNKDMVASVSPDNSIESIIGLLTASMGYITVVPDYLGFGVSDLMHPYLHVESLVPCVIDFLRACRSYTTANQITLNDQVFLTGYSEGGYMTLAAQKILEENYTAEFDLTAVAPLAGPYNLEGMMDTIFQSNTYSTPAYIAYILTAYNEVYGWNRLDDFFLAPYSTKMAGLFDGSKSWTEIVNQLPETFSELMNPAFISDYNNGHEPDVSAAMHQNTLLNWKPQTPIHFFHGDADSIVPYYNVTTAIEVFNANGAENIQITTIPGGTHETSGPIAIIGAIEWFESLSVVS